MRAILALILVFAPGCRHRESPDGIAIPDPPRPKAPRPARPVAFEIDVETGAIAPVAWIAEVPHDD